ARARPLVFANPGGARRDFARTDGSYSRGLRSNHRRIAFAIVFDATRRKPSPQLLSSLFGVTGRLIPAASAPLMGPLTLSSRVVSGGGQALYNFLLVSAQFFPCLHDAFMTARAASANVHGRYPFLAKLCVYVDFLIV